MTPTQVRMARAALDLSQEELGRHAEVDADAIAAIAGGGGSPDVAAKLRATFEAAGIEFLGEDGVKFHPIAAPGRGAIPLDRLNSANDE